MSSLVAVPRTAAAHLPDDAQDEDLHVSPQVENALEMIETLVNVWTADAPVAAGSLENTLRHRLGLPLTGGLQTSVLEAAVDETMSALSSARVVLRNAGALVEHSEQGKVLAGFLNGVENRVRIAAQHLRLGQHLCTTLQNADMTGDARLSNVQLGDPDGAVAVAERNEEVNPKPLNEMQKVLLHVMSRMATMGVRVHNGVVYEQVRTRAGQATHTWTPMQEHDADVSVQDFVYSLCTPQAGGQLFLWATSHGSVMRNVVEYLTRMRDPVLSGVHPDRKYIAFENGVYQLHSGGQGTQRTVDVFHPWSAPLPSKVVAVTYHPHEMPLTWFQAADITKIPTPSLDTILRTQGMPSDAAMVMYALLGRMLHPVNFLDRWAVLPLNLGASGTGKSVIITTVEAMLGDGSMGIIESDCDAKYITAAVHKKYTWACTELRGHSALPVGRLFALITGERMSSRAMRSDPVFVRVAAPGWIAGNQVPRSWDTVDATLRRMVVFTFNSTPERRDTQLEERLKGPEMPALILKSNRAYLTAVQDVGRRELAACLPLYFKSTSAFLRRIMDPVGVMMQDGGMNMCVVPRAVLAAWVAFVTALPPVRSSAEKNGASTVGPKSALGVWTGHPERPGCIQGMELPWVRYDGKLYTSACCSRLEAVWDECEGVAAASRGGGGASGAAGGGGAAGAGGNNRSIATLSRALSEGGLPVVSSAPDSTAVEYMSVVGIYAAAAQSSCVVEDTPDADVGREVLDANIPQPTRMEVLQQWRASHPNQVVAQVGDALHGGAADSSVQWRLTAAPGAPPLQHGTVSTGQAAANAAQTMALAVHSAHRSAEAQVRTAAATAAATAGMAANAQRRGGGAHAPAGNSRALRAALPQAPPQDNFGTLSQTAATPRQSAPHSAPGSPVTSSVHSEEPPSPEVEPPVFTPDSPLAPKPRHGQSASGEAASRRTLLSLEDAMAEEFDYHTETAPRAAGVRQATGALKRSRGDVQDESPAAAPKAPRRQQDSSSVPSGSTSTAFRRHDGPL